MSRISFNEVLEPIINLDELATNELESTGYCQVEDDYFVVKVDHCYFVTKAINFAGLNLNCKEEEN